MGRLANANETSEILALSEKINAPVFADPLSQIRYTRLSQNVISGYDHFLSLAHVNPDYVLRFGAKPTSKILCQRLNEWADRTGAGGSAWSI